ncbi:uncharacterized protein LOC127811706 isoform X2 [Diospyros lotus]|uniref:uncharacterized protein LOC127811706 isoform X2 n=1 Tax=Diospyros lotus TaxID=55363 RepID=UPI002256D83E|nr:uncharacterized protein LOC127811706 isoform X2 [Diospyros lotus]
MDKQELLPLEVGQFAESRSFQIGFRSAWFRCKIKEIICRRGHIVYALEFFDYPDEKVTWTRIYQMPRTCKKSKEMKRHLMVRPQYPPIYHESQAPRDNTSEVKVVINGDWRVGDLVDWWCNGCYWSGRVTQLIGKDKVQIDLPPPPIGEGKSYEVFCKDLRPSLVWSPEHSWSVPTSKEGETSCHCAQLIKPLNQASLPNLKIDAVGEETEDTQATAGSPFDPSVSSPISAHSEESPGQPLISRIPEGEPGSPEANMDGSVIGKIPCSDSVSISDFSDASSETAGNKDQNCSRCFKKMRTSGSISLNSMHSDSLEASILDLEELVNKVKWLRNILESDVPLPNAGRLPWRFIEHRASSVPK